MAGDEEPGQFIQDLFEVDVSCSLGRAVLEPPRLSGREGLQQPGPLGHIVIEPRHQIDPRGGAEIGPGQRIHTQHFRPAPTGIGIDWSKIEHRPLARFHRPHMRR